MNVLIKQARIIAPTSPYHRQVMDILISGGLISAISKEINVQADKTIQMPNLHVSIGWMDMFAHFCDPGQENKETIESGALAAAAGGFTDVCLVPDTNPAISTKSQVEYIINKSAKIPVNLHPIGSITRNTEGKDLSDMYDMQQSGAIAFSDGFKPIQSAGILTKAMQYVKPLACPVIQIPDDRTLSAHGLMNEGITSTRLGLPGKPALAEEIMVARDIALLRYTGSRLHITGISTRKSIALVKEAKKDGLNITCSTTPYHLHFCDEDLRDYDTNLKVNPPLRTREDMMALREALHEAVIDCIASHHQPQHTDDKNCEFEYAGYGMIGLESLFGAVRSVYTNIDKLIASLTTIPRNILSIPAPSIQENEPACLTLFNPDETYTFHEKMIRSASGNTAFKGKELTGKPYGIIHKNHIFINES